MNNTLRINLHMRVKSIVSQHVKERESPDAVVSTVARSVSPALLASALVDDAPDRNGLQTLETIQHNGGAPRETIVNAFFAMCKLTNTLHSIGIAHGGISKETIAIDETGTNLRLGFASGAYGIAIDRADQEGPPEWFMRREHKDARNTTYEERCIKRGDIDPSQYVRMSVELRQGADTYSNRMRSTFALYDIACIGYVFQDVARDCMDIVGIASSLTSPATMVEESHATDASAKRLFNAVRGRPWLQSVIEMKSAVESN